MEPFDPGRSIFIHGLEGTSQGVKAELLRRRYPQMLIPDFVGSLDDRRQQLAGWLGDQNGWTLIGSSLGGLMAASFACLHPEQVRRLVLLAPALIWPDFANHLPPAIDVPTIMIHGRQDEIIPVDLVCPIAERLFTHLKLIRVDDDHGLYKTVHSLNWQDILESR